MRAACLSVVVTCTVLVLGASAGAESVTIKGTGDVVKLSATNGKDALTVKVWGFDKPCKAHYFKITVQWGTKAGYSADGGCYNGAPPKWITSLVYEADRNAGAGGKLLKCDRFRVTFNAEEKSYRAFIPRSCIPRADDKVRVSVSGDNYASARGGAAGPTKRLGRG